MTRLDLEAIRARCDAATKGPWRVDGNTYDEDCNEHLAPYGLEGPNERMIWSSGGGEYSHPDMATAQFIAHTRADIPALLAYIDELVRERDEAREGRDLARERLENAIQSATRYAVERDEARAKYEMLYEEADRALRAPLLALSAIVGGDAFFAPGPWDSQTQGINALAERITRSFAIWRDRAAKQLTQDFERGAEAMRFACQQWCRAWENDGTAIADALADLRVEDKP